LCPAPVQDGFIFVRGNSKNFSAGFGSRFFEARSGLRNAAWKVREPTFERSAISARLRPSFATFRRRAAGRDRAAKVERNL